MSRNEVNRERELYYEPYRDHRRYQSYPSANYSSTKMVENFEGSHCEEKPFENYENFYDNHKNDEIYQDYQGYNYDNRYPEHPQEPGYYDDGYYAPEENRGLEYDYDDVNYYYEAHRRDLARSDRGPCIEGIKQKRREEEKTTNSHTKKRINIEKPLSTKK